MGTLSCLAEEHLLIKLRDHNCIVALKRKDVKSFLIESARKQSWKRQEYGMNSGRTVFAQLIEHLPHKEFQKCVARYRGDRYAKNFSCWDQYLAMAFAQFTYRESLRDIETCLGAVGDKLYHMGFRTSVARSTLADANESRDWRIYADFAQTLIATARNLYTLDPLAVDLEQSLYALDSTTIDLCLALFPWARFRHRRGRSRCTRCWTCAAISRRSSTSPMAKCTM